MTTKYRYIGKGTTDSNGIAHMTEDADGQTVTGYTGTGKGLTDIIASTDDSTKISDSSILSEIFATIDGTFKDIAVTGQKNTNWYTPSNNFSVQTDDEGTLLSSSSSSALHYWVNNYLQIDIGAFAVEFDLISYNNNESAIRVQGTTSHQIYFGEVNCPQNCHFKLIVDGTKIKYQIDNGAIVDFVTTTNTAFYVGFRFATVSTMKYRNFVVYPI